MSSNAMKSTMEDLLQLPASRLKDGFSPLLERIRHYGAEKILEERPDFLAGLLGKLKEADAARVFNGEVKAADQLSDFLWEGVEFLASQSKEMKSLLAKVERDFHVNIEASDSPFRSHFVVEKGKIRGKSGLLHFKIEDFRFMGPTEVLIDLVTGDLFLGFGNLRLQTAGHPGWVKRVAPILRETSRLLKGG